MLTTKSFHRMIAYVSQVCMFAVASSSHKCAGSFISVTPTISACVEESTDR